MNLDELRQKYLNMPPYVYDVTIGDDLFTEKEISDIVKYGNWFNAIWNGDVELTTDKLKHFYAAKKDDFKKRTKWEDLWYRYKQNEISFL